MNIVIGQEFVQKVLALIRDAKRDIKICVFDWRWYPNDPSNPAQIFNHALVTASRRGIKITAVTNDDHIIATLQGEGIFAKKLLSRNLLHAKFMVIDDEVFVLGSHNYTQNAFTTNFEVSIIGREVESSLRLRDFFNLLYA